MTQVMSYGVKPPIVRRINFRMLTIIAVFGVLVGYPVYTFVKAQRNGGIEAVGGGVYHVDLKAMGNFPFDGQRGTLADVPKLYRDLDGKQVTLEGFLYDPNASTDRSSSAQFVYNVAKCCFGGPPRVQERVFVVAPPGSPMYNPGMYTMVQLTGTMHVSVEKDDAGNVSSVYRLDVAKEQLVS